MSAIEFSHKGDFKITSKFLTAVSGGKYADAVLERYAKKGLDALRHATPVRTGLTASSWSYEIERNGSSATIYWKNSNVNQHVNIAMIIQTGHGTRTGGYVQGIDYINPALRPIFDKLADDLWKEVKSK